MLSFLLSLILVPLILSSCDVPIIPEAPHYYKKPVWELAQYEDLTVSIGDTLEFYFIEGLHDVHVFTKDHHYEWASCQFTEDTLGIDEIEGEVMDTINFYVGGNSTIPLPISLGNYTFTEETTVYFACGQGGGTHCLDGQKFEVKVVNNTSNQKPKIFYPKYKKIPSWTLLGYPDLRVSKGDRLIFKYDSLTTDHDVWMMENPCSLDGATLIGDEDDGSGFGLEWSAKCPKGKYPCRVFLGCSCRPTGALGMSEEGCGLGAGDGPLLHCYSGMGFYVNIRK